MKKHFFLAVVIIALLTAAVSFGMASFASEIPTVSIKYHNLSYKSNVSIKYAVDVTGLPEGASIADVVGVKVRKGSPASSTVYEAEYEGQHTIYGVEYAVFGFSELSAAEMTVDVYATPYVKISDTTVTGKTHKNSVLDYSYKILESDSFDDSVKNLVSRMLSYGAAVQNYSGYNTDRLADADYYQISVAGGTLPDGFAKGLYQKGESVTLTAKTKEGYIPESWKNSAGDSVGSGSELSVTVGAANETYTAVFKQTPITYMEYDIPDNFFDGYEDPFGMKSADYKKMVVKLIDAGTYRISYADAQGGTFSADFVKKAWGMWMMGAMKYTEENGTVHTITNSATDYEFVLMCKGKGTYRDFRSGNHGNYPGRDQSNFYYEDDTSLFNDRLLDMTFYDGKSGEKIELTTVGDSVTVDGLRIVIHHNVYEMNYKKDNVLLNSTRSYLYNGYDVMFDAKLSATQDVHFADGTYSAMMPVEKAYGNSAMFYCVDGSTVYMKTPLSNAASEKVMGVNATKIDIWGENNPEYHMTVTLNNPEDQLRNSVENSTAKGYTGFRDQGGSYANKLYCSLFSQSGTLYWGESLNFNTTYSFSIQEDFVNPDREPDYRVGVAD